MSNASRAIKSNNKKVLLIGWEGADWRLMEPLLEAGLMPNLADMTDRGLMGRFSSLIPMVCPILWSSIATGALGSSHDILTFVEPNGCGDVRPAQSTSRRRKAIWNILSESGLRSSVIAWPATHPSEPIEGIIVSDRFPHATGPAAELWPADQHTVHPPDLHDRLMGLRVSPEQLSIKQLTSFVPRLSEIDLKNDQRIAHIATLLAQAASVQKAATWLAQQAAWDFMAVHFGMLGGLSHGFLQYQAPPAEGVSEQDSELYGDAVMTGYKLYDMMLGRLLQLVGPETLVILVSDHGFNKTPISIVPKHLEFKIASLPSEPRYSYLRYHRRDGVICITGPGVREDELIHGAKLTSIAPTILAYFGLAAPRDMNGYPLSNIFKAPMSTKSIRSYEKSAAHDGIHPRDIVEDTWATQEIIDRMAALRLISLDSKTAAALELCNQHRDLNRAEIHMSEGQFEDALRIYQELLKSDDSFLIRVPIIQCLINLKRFDDAEAEL
ncbi:MAG: alkaline phosphatase family protein, partial [Planctomycetota bacterium]